MTDITWPLVFFKLALTGIALWSITGVARDSSRLGLPVDRRAVLALFMGLVALGLADTVTLESSMDWLLVGAAFGFASGRRWVLHELFTK